MKEHANISFSWDTKTFQEVHNMMKNSTMMVPDGPLTMKFFNRRELIPLWSEHYVIKYIT